MYTSPAPWNVSLTFDPATYATVWDQTMVWGVTPYLVGDAIKLARALEPLNIMWLEDLLTGDYVPWVHADVYREVTHSTSTPIHTGEQIYLRQNFKELIEKHCGGVRGGWDNLQAVIPGGASCSAGRRRSI